MQLDRRKLLASAVPFCLAFRVRRSGANMIEPTSGGMAQRASLARALVEIDQKSRSGHLSSASIALRRCIPSRLMPQILLFEACVASLT